MKNNTLSVDISEAVPNDPYVAALCAEQRVEHDEADDAPTEPITYLLARLRPIRRRLSTPTIVGCAGLEQIEVGVGEIKRMYVRPDYRGNGVSRALLVAVEELARDRGYTSVRLEMGDLQPEAMGLYASSGYVRIPRFGGNALCYEKRLSTVSLLARRSARYSSPSARLSQNASS